MANHQRGIVSRIGGGVVVRGTIRGEGDIELSGRVEGSIDVDGEVTIEDSGRIKSPVNGGRVVVRGAVLGDIRGSESVVLESGAKVVGDLSAPSIGIRPGGLFRGHVASGEGAAAPAPSRASASRNTEVATPAPRAVRQPAQRGRPRAEVVEAPPPPPAPAPRTKRQAPAPVMPTIQKGAKAALKKKAR